MKKRKVVSVDLIMDGDREIVNIVGDDEVTDSKFLTQFLDRGIRNKNIKLGKKFRQGGYTRYKFNVEVMDKNDELINYDFVVKVKNSEKSLHFQTLKYIDALCDMSVIIKRENITRFIAGLAAGTIVLLTAGPTIAKGIDKILEKEFNYAQNAYDNHYKYIPTEEDKEKAMEEYYDDLEERAKQGDKDAIEEYSQYLTEQEIKKSRGLK